MAVYDVVVVGAGNAALAAAVSAAENGAGKVLVLEKAPMGMRGGNTHWSGGMLRFAYGDPQNLVPLLPGAEDQYPGFYEGISPYTTDDFFGDLSRVTNGRCDPVLSRLVVDQSKDTVLWMNRVGGIKMEPAISIAAVKKGDRFVWIRGLVLRAEHEGVGLSTMWFDTCERLGIEVRYEHAVTGLVVNESGRVCAVTVRTSEGIVEIEAGSVVLACGGFEANVQMRTQHIGPLVGGAKVRGTPHNQGDGLRMALEIGAMPWGQWSGCHATPISADWGDFAPREMTDRSNRLSYPYSIMLNRAGKRFVDEGENTQMMTYAKFGREILSQPGAKVWQLFDSTTVPYLESRYETSRPIVSDTIEGLVAQLDIEDKARALATIAEYNAACRTHRGDVTADPDAHFDATRLDGLATQGLAIEKSNWALPLSNPPYYAYSATGGITFTFGGLRVNRQAEVVGTDWRPIQGLYACGEMVGGLYYDNYPAGTGLVAGATFGRIAGRNAALGTPVLLDEVSPGRGAKLNPPVQVELSAAPIIAGREQGWVP